MSTRPIADRPTPRPRTGAVRMRRVLVLAGCSVLGVGGLSACESTEQESAKIGHESEAAARAAAKPAAKVHATTRAHGHGRGSSGHDASTHGKGSSSR
jgi:hypothetical protein